MFIYDCEFKQPMRTPSRASVNAIVKENIEKIDDAAKYEGMKSQIARLQSAIATGRSLFRAATSECIMARLAGFPRLPAFQHEDLQA